VLALVVQIGEFFGDICCHLATFFGFYFYYGGKFEGNSLSHHVHVQLNHQLRDALGITVLDHEQY